MKISVLGSGSRGNAIFLETDSLKILIDAGFSGKKIAELLESIGEKIEMLDAILITHEHGDHIQGVGIVSRKYGVPIFITKESYEKGALKLGKISNENLNFIEGEFFLGDTKIIPFDVMHDAERTVGFRIEESTGKKIAISTDLGYIDNIVREAFKKVDVMIIECNYDYHMLMECSYPWELKARVKGRNGHLSNNDCARFINEMYHKDLKKVYLAHISKDSNHPKLAYETVNEELKRNRKTVDIVLGMQDEVTKIFEF